MAENEVKVDKNLENEVNPGLTFGILKGKALGFVKGEITKEELAKWGNTLTVITSIPMTTKMGILMNLTTKYYYSNTEQQEMIICELYRNMFFGLYLRYLGVEEVYDEDITYDNYDIMEPLYGPWIEAIAGRDIATFKEMLDKSISLYASSNLIESMDAIDVDAMKQTLEDNKEVLRKLSENKEFIKDLKDLVAYNDPMLAKVVEELKQVEIEKQTQK